MFLNNPIWGQKRFRGSWITILSNWFFFIFRTLGFNGRQVLVREQTARLLIRLPEIKRRVNRHPTKRHHSTDDAH